MKVWLDGTNYEGRVVDLRARAIDERVLAAAAHSSVDATTSRSLMISCQPPTAVYGYAGHVHEGMGLRCRTALAAAARSRGMTTEYDGDISRLREKLDEFGIPEPTMPSVPDPVPAATVSELEATVAARRGRIEAHETLTGESPRELRERRESAVAGVTERATERRAAEQTRERRRIAARQYRQRLDDRRAVADRLANTERRARAALVEQARDRFAAALDALPGPTPSDPFDGDPVAAALAVLRVARTDTPVVLTADRFASPAAAADYLDAPVIRC